VVSLLSTFARQLLRIALQFFLFRAFAPRTTLERLRVCKSVISSLKCSIFVHAPTQCTHVHSREKQWALTRKTIRTHAKTMGIWNHSKVARRLKEMVTADIMSGAVDGEKLDTKSFEQFDRRRLYSLPRPIYSTLQTVSQQQLDRCSDYVATRQPWLSLLPPTHSLSDR